MVRLTIERAISIAAVRTAPSSAPIVCDTAPGPGSRLSPEALLLEDDRAPPDVPQAEIHRHDQAVLAHVGLVVVRDGLDAVTDHFTIEDRVGLFRPDHPEPAVGGEGLHDSAGQEVLDGGLRRLVREDRDRHRLDVVRKVARNE